MKKNPSEFASLLNDNNAPRSPEYLDQKILDHARRRAPHKPVRTAWMPLLATASVACVAVLLVLRQPQPVNVDKTLLDDQAAALEMDFYDGAGSVQAPVLEEIVVGDSVRKEQQEKKNMPGHTAVAAVRSGVVELETAGMDAAEESAPTQRLEPATVAKKNVPMGLTTANTMSKNGLFRRLTMADVKPMLVDLQGLLQAGKQQQAYADYEALKKQCLQCELPDQLEDALEKILSQERKPPSADD